MKGMRRFTRPKGRAREGNGEKEGAGADAAGCYALGGGGDGFGGGGRRKGGGGRRTGGGGDGLAGGGGATPAFVSSCLQTGSAAPTWEEGRGGRGSESDTSCHAANRGGSAHAARTAQPWHTQAHQLPIRQVHRLPVLPTLCPPAAP